MNSIFDDTLPQHTDVLQSTLDSNFPTSTLTEGQNFDPDIYSHSTLDDNPLTETHQINHFPPPEDHWHNTDFHSVPEHSLSQKSDSSLNDSDSSDDSDNQKIGNLTLPTFSQNNSNSMLPTFEHHVHYHPPHDHFRIPDSWEEHPSHSETHTLHSSVDVNVSGSIDHRHRWVEPNNSYINGNDSGSNYSDIPFSDTNSNCVDANGDGVCNTSSDDGN